MKLGFVTAILDSWNYEEMMDFAVSYTHLAADLHSADGSNSGLFHDERGSDRAGNEIK